MRGLDALHVIRAALTKGGHPVVGCDGAVDALDRVEVVLAEYERVLREFVGDFDQGGWLVGDVYQDAKRALAAIDGDHKEWEATLSDGLDGEGGAA